MTAELHSRATELFLEVCDLPPDECERILADTGLTNMVKNSAVPSLMANDSKVFLGP